jgi:predicted RNA-binding Zn-ribbon protein involved in translation (DUF1610 family)
MSLSRRLRMLERHLSAEPRCAQCGYPGDAVAVWTSSSDEPLRCCSSCGRSLTPAGKPIEVAIWLRYVDCREWHERGMGVV